MLARYPFCCFHPCLRSSQLLPISGFGIILQYHFWCASYPWPVFAFSQPDLALGIPLSISRLAGISSHVYLCVICTYKYSNTIWHRKSIIYIYTYMKSWIQPTWHEIAIECMLVLQIQDSRETSWITILNPGQWCKRFAWNRESWIQPTS